MRAPPQLAPFHLTDFDLDFVTSYKYLGVHFQADMGWETYTEQIITRATRVAAVICSHIVPRKPPGLGLLSKR
jgi:hypothetical protein